VRCDKEAGVDMEILRFEDQEPKAPNRKKSSRGLVVVGLIATLFGISSAFASSTITINNGSPINLAQGVQAVTGCDSKIGLNVETRLKSDLLNFSVETLTVGYEYNTDSAYRIDASASAGSCKDKSLKVQFYKKHDGASPTALTCSEMGNAFTFTGVSGSITYSKCADAALYFKVLEGVDQTFIRFNNGFDPGSFDAITLESVETNYPS
jgi:hypothetical protein